jgi:ATP-dependent exoDNAse (exonuclease V) beta subunit
VALAEIAPAREAIEYEWARETARRVGTVVHRWLLRMAEEGVGRWDAARLARQRAAFAAALARLGVPAAELEEAAGRVRAALANVLEDARGRWLLDGHHAEARSEQALTGVLDGRLVSVVLDRSFVDNDGVRWIVDYKTGMHAGADVEAFLERERERYAPQLERYARLLAAGAERRPIRLGLYFPLLRGWREWGASN